MLNKLTPVPTAHLWCAPHHLQLVPTQNIIYTEMLNVLVTNMGNMLEDDFLQALTAARELLL
jgi:hypothetical protein